MKKLNKVLLMLVVLMTVSTSTVATAAITTSHAGHGGVDPGAVSGQYREADIARMINNQIVAKSGAVDATDNSAISVNDNLSKIVN
ncbi:Ply protein, partial [Carnobacterium divergens]